MKLLGGTIFGDICGSIYEFAPCKEKDKIRLFGEGCNFTDDTVMTIAIADWCINGGDVKDYLVKYGYMYQLPKGGYGSRFNEWLFNTKDENRKPYFSYANGSCMRCSACGWLFNTLEETLEKAKESAEVTHNHPDAIKAAQATAAAIYKLRNGATKQELKDYLEKEFEYDLSVSLNEMRKTSKFEISAKKTMPQALISFLESHSIEECCINAISLGSDADTVAAIACSIAEAYYGIPKDIEEKVKSYLPENFIEIIEEVNTIYEEKIKNGVIISGETMQINKLVHEVKDLCEVKEDRPIIPICVDFDATIVKSNYPYIGEPNPLALETMKEFTEKYNVGWILDTMRPDNLRNDAIEYLRINGIKLYGVGKNPTQDRWTDSNKAYAPFSIDDRNVGTPMIYEDNEAPYVNWKKIRKILTPILDEMVSKYRKSINGHD